MHTKNVLEGIPGFNPYFTGSLTATPNRLAFSLFQVKFQSLFYWKSYCNSCLGISQVGKVGVSILILLEVLLQLCSKNLSVSELWRFNPYFTGSLTATRSLLSNQPLQSCFNPYFTGSLTATACKKLFRASKILVSILILLEVLLQQ